MEGMHKIAARMGSMDMHDERLAAMITVRREFDAAKTARVAALVRAQVFVLSGVLTVTQASHALGISVRTWHKWSTDLGLRELARECMADVDHSLRDAGATDDTTVADVKANPDLALASGSAGVWPKRTNWDDGPPRGKAVVL